MKKMIFTIFCLMLILETVYAESFKSPDIIIDTKLESDWTGFLLGKIRRLLKNSGIEDPLNMKIEKPIVVTDSLIEDFLDHDSRYFLQNLGSLIGLSLVKTSTKVTLHGLAYNAVNVKGDLRALSDSSKEVRIDAHVNASKLTVQADKVTLSLIMPGPSTSSQTSIDIEIIKPIVRVSGGDIINFHSIFKISDYVSEHRFFIESTDFTPMAESLLLNMDKIFFGGLNEIRVPKIQIVIGGKTLTISEEKIRKLLLENQNVIKSILVTQFAQLLKGGVGEDIIKIIEDYPAQKKQWYEIEPLHLNLNLEQFHTDIKRNNLEIVIPGDFCTTAMFDNYKDDCVENKDSKPLSSRITNEIHLRSLSKLRDWTDRLGANLVASVSEDFVNKLLAATIDGEMWDSVLKEAGITLGPNKMGVRLDQEGENATFIMDVIYKPRKLERFLIGEKSVQFPLVANASIRIEKREIGTFLVIRLNDVIVDDKILMEGIPEWGFRSNLKNLRFKKKVISKIVEEVSSVTNQDILEINIPEINGLGLESAQFVSDGLGRMNAVLKTTEND